MNHHLSSIGYFSFFWGKQFCINEFHQVFQQFPDYASWIILPVVNLFLVLHFFPTIRSDSISFVTWFHRAQQRQ